MPTYAIECCECGAKRDHSLTFAEYDAVQDGSRKLACKACGKEARLAFCVGSFGLVLKEGESGGWASKSIKENAYRRDRIDVMKRKQRDHVFKPTLQPNYNGMETGSWKEAREEARREKGNTSAATYDPLVKGA